MFGHKRLYTEGAEAEGQVYALTSYGDVYGGTQDFGVKVRVNLPNGSVKEFEKGPLRASDVGFLSVGSMVPVRYDRENPSKVVLDTPALKARQAQSQAAQQAQLDAQFNHPGQSRETGGGGDLRSQLLQLAAQGGAQVVDLQSASGQPGAGADPVERLAKLAELKKAGLLSEDEFAAAKAKVLGESHATGGDG